jgi:hypothetical protein
MLAISPQAMPAISPQAMLAISPQVMLAISLVAAVISPEFNLVRVVNLLVLTNMA